MKEREKMNTKYIDKEISMLARMEQLESISQQGLDKLKEFRYLRDLAKGQLLPTDDDIIKQGKAKYPYKKKTSDGTYYEGKCKGYIEGAMWLKDKIKQL